MVFYKGNARNEPIMTTTTIHWSYLEEILVTERTRLLGLCTHLTGDPDSAEDVLQEVMVEA